MIYFKKQDIKKVLAFISEAINLKDNIALKKIINFPNQRFSEMQLQELEYNALEENITLFNAIKKHSRAHQDFISSLEAVKDVVLDLFDDAAEIFKETVAILNLEGTYKETYRRSKLGGFRNSIFKNRLLEGISE